MLGFLSKLLKVALISTLLASILPVAAARHKEYGTQNYIYMGEFAKLRHKAELGDPDALFVLGNYYYKPPRGTNFKKDLRKSAEYYFKASVRGNPAAQYNYAFMLSKGQGVAKNLLESYIWFRLAAENDSPVAKHINHLSKNAVEVMGKQLTKVQRLLAEKKIQYYAKAIASKRYHRIKFANHRK
ncbi:MAG: tetratricopeptide repeat protein [Enterobacterales bacterium]|nr:tetratricopeptide repeat protein [Enterobacterales bacterium]